MADIAVDDLAAASTPLTGSEIIYVVQGGNSRQTTVGAFFAALLASDIPYEPLSAGNIAAVDVQAAIEELDSEKVAKSAVPFALIIACSDEATPLTAGTHKVVFRAPHAMTLTEVRASLGIAQTSGSIFTVDINISAASILSTKLTIDNGEGTSTTATTPAVISDDSVIDDAPIQIDIDQVGDGTAKGLKVTLIGTRSV